MTKKVLEFKLRDGDYWTADGKRVCAEYTRKYFNVEKTFDLHVSTSPPRHDEYYILTPPALYGRIWKAFDGPDAGKSPWPIWLDGWFLHQFGRSKIYVWAMG